MKAFISVLVLAALATPAGAAPPPEELVQKLSGAIRKHCPEAVIEVTGDGFAAKHGTMTYTLHGRSKTGEVSAETYPQEGPNYKGFMLSVALRDGGYEGAAKVPQTLQGPYFPTFLDAVPVDAGKKHYYIHFSYGNRIDRELMKAIVDAIPRSRLPPSAAAFKTGGTEYTFGKNVQPPGTH